MNRQSTNRLPTRVDQLLSSLGAPSPADEKGSQARLARIMATVEHTAQDTTDPRLLDAPLPREPGEPQAFTESAGLCRESGEHAFLTHRDAVRGSTAGIAASRHRRLWNWTFAGAGLLAAAAGAFFWVHTPAGAPSMLPESTTMPRDLVAATIEVAPPNRSAASDLQAVDEEGAAKSSTSGPKSSSLTAPAHRRASAGAGSPASMAKASQKPGQDSPSLDQEPELHPAAGPAGLPDHPTTGAIQAALASRQPRAQSCVATLGGPVSVNLVLGSNGHVSRIDVGAPAAGTPSEDCIRAALLGTQVEPFARSSFSVPLTLRPH